MTPPAATPNYWQRQTGDQPLFSSMLWSRPENRQLAGKLLVVGGNAHGFAMTADVYNQALEAGIGTARVMLPDSLAKTLGRAFDAGEFAPSTPSGSFSQKALAELLSLAHWSDGVVMGGDLGRNSETAILFESFITKYQGQLTLLNDGTDYAINLAKNVLHRPNTTLVVDFSQLQRLFTAARVPKAITSDMDLLRLTEALHLFSLQHAAHLVVLHDRQQFVAVQGSVSSTAHHKGGETALHWQAAAAAKSAVWWLQHPQKAFEALTSASL